MKRASVVFLVLVLLALSAAAANAVVYFPDLQFVNFDPGTFTYTYRVTCPENSTYPFGRLTILAEVPQGGIYFPWGHGADTAPTTAWRFYTVDREWDDDWNPTKSNAVWSYQQGESDFIPAETYWTGLFTLVVPNSSLTEGVGFTMDGGPWSESPPAIVNVPGPGAYIPEPSSLLALGGLVGGLLPLMRRRR